MEFLTQRIKALYTFDENNRLLEANEPDTQQITPRLYLMRTESDILWRLRHDVSDAIASELAKVVEKEIATQDFSQPLQYHAEYVIILEKIAPLSKINSGPAYTLPEMSLSGKAIRITDDNTGLLAEHFSWTLEIFDFRSPILAIIEDNVAVAICFCAEKTDKVAEAGVYTMDDYRKRGYAEAVVRDWSIALRESGLIPIYSTSDDNLASQAVARKLGAIQFATDFSFT